MNIKNRIKAIERKAGGGAAVTVVFLGDDHRTTDKAYSAARQLSR